MDVDTDPPQHMCAYLKMRYGGWIPSIPPISSSGPYFLHPLTSPTNNSYIISSPRSATEYYVIEYRKREGTFESSLPGEGLLVYRINRNASGDADGPPDEIYVYRPDGSVGCNGRICDANFGGTGGRSACNDSTNPPGFLSEGSPGGLDISDIGLPDSVISFWVKQSWSSVCTVAGYVRTLSPPLPEPVQGVVMSGLPGDPVTNIDGGYSCAVPPGWSGIVSPTLFGFFFEPPSTPYYNITSDLRSDYAGMRRFVTISGYVRSAGGEGISDVVMSGLPRKTSTDENGYYRGIVDEDWTGTVAPVKSGWMFSPKSTCYVALRGNQTTDYAVETIGVGPNDAERPGDFSVSMSFPNPFNSSTVITYQLPIVCEVKLAVYDLLGREVAVLVDERKMPGSYELKFDGSNLASGVYFYRLSAGQYIECRKMTVLK
jgi:hypothetical protein